MSKTDPISNFERRAILAFAFLSFVYFVSFLAAEAAREYLSVENTHSLISFAVDDPTPRVPAGLHLISLFIFLALIRPKRYWVSTGITILYAILFLLSLYLRVNGETFFGGPYPREIGYFQELYLKTWIWDYAAGIFLLILIPWQISILARMNNRFSERRALP